MMVKFLLPVLLVSTLWCSTSFTGVQAQSLLAGAFTEEQATRGQSLYYQHCLVCHGEMMNGQDQAPPLAGPQFSGAWAGEPLWAPLTRIDTMPPDKPGKLTRAESVDVLTYLLWFNGLPMGTTALVPDQTVLTKLVFETAPLNQ